jgi:hypothetical protein
MDGNMISLLNSTPGIMIRKQTGVVRKTIDPSDWVKLLTMQNPMMVVRAGQWIRVRNGAYKGDLGFCVRVLVVPRLKTPTSQGTSSLKRK